MQGGHISILHYLFLFLLCQRRYYDFSHCIYVIRNIITTNYFNLLTYSVTAAHVPQENFSQKFYACGDAPLALRIQKLPFGRRFTFILSYTLKKEVNRGLRGV